MRKIFTSFLAMAVPAVLFASGAWTLQGKDYVVDTLFHAKVGPGTTQTSLRATGGSNLNIFYTTTDLTNPYVEMRGVMANNKLASVTTVTKMAQASNKEGALYFAGVNADFFGNSAPIGTTVTDGSVWYASNNGWTHWAIDGNKTPYLGQMAIGGTVTNAAGSASHNITAINAGRGENNLIIYNSNFGATTGTNDYGAEVVITPVDGDFALGKEVKMKVTGTPTTKGSNALSAGSYILSGHGTAKNFVTSLTDGEIITVNATLSLNDKSIEARQVLGGQPMILSGGVTLDTQDALDHLVSLNPRTAVGHDATGTKLVMLVVDGRSNVSAGVVSRVLADIMREVGCSEAMNFDGGGSSALYTDAFGIRNSPSDGNERSVTNALFAVAVAPTDNVVDEIAFTEESKMLPKYGHYTPVFYAYNKYDVLISTDLKGVKLSCPEALGTISADGASLFVTGSGTHMLTATIDGVSTSIPVTVGTGAPKFRLANAMVNSFTDYVVEVTATVGNEEMPLDNQALKWSSDDESIATVDAAGRVHGVKNGTTTIRGTVEDFVGELTVTVEIPETRYMPLDANIDIATWKYNKSGVKNDAVSVIGSQGFAFDYTVSSTRGTYVKLTKDVVMWSMPDSLRICINPGTATIKEIYINTQAGANRAVNYIYTPTLTASTLNTVLIPMSEMIDVTDFSSYPVTFKYLQIYLADAASSTHRIEIPAIEAVHTSVAHTPGSVETIVADDNATLVLAPNPAVAGEDVAVNVSENAQYRIYTMSGALVKSGIGNKIATANLASGMYMIAISDNNGIQAARLIVK